VKNKIITVDEAVELIHEGMTLMVGGFMSVGTPEILMDGIVEKKIGNLTVIANDSGVPGRGIGKLVTAGLLKRLLASHIGLNQETGMRMNSGELEVELIPQGTLAEQIRSGGMGLGGVLTPTGIGTDVEKGKEKLTIQGREYLLELPLRADIALIRGSIVDKAGNIYYHGTTRNFNPLMAMAADIVIAAAEKIVEVGELDPHDVMTPAAMVDYIVGGEA